MSVSGRAERGRHGQRAPGRERRETPAASQSARLTEAEPGPKIQGGVGRLEVASAPPSLSNSQATAVQCNSNNDKWWQNWMGPCLRVRVCACTPRRALETPGRIPYTLRWQHLEPQKWESCGVGGYGLSGGGGDFQAGTRPSCLSFSKVRVVV